MNVLVTTEGMSREEWLTWRNKGLGGSDAAAACGLSRWKSPMELWLEKTGQMEPVEAGEYAYWGTVMEPLIRQEFTKRTGFIVQEEKAIIKHSKFGFMLANVDGFVDDPVNGKGIFEAKTANAFAAKDWEVSLPDEYMLQIQHYLAVTELEFAYVSVLFGGNTFQWRFVPRDEAVIKMLIKLEAKFWHLVETNTPPSIDGSKASGELLKRLYPEGKKNSTVELPEEARSLIEQYERAKAAEHEALSIKEEASNKLKELMGKHEVGLTGDRTVSWKTVKSERLNSKLLKAEHPDIYKKYLETSVSRRFSIK